MEKAIRATHSSNQRLSLTRSQNAFLLIKRFVIHVSMVNVTMSEVEIWMMAFGGYLLSLPWHLPRA